MPPVRPDFGAGLERVLDGLNAKGRRRALAPREGIDFTSNDYLGLANSPRIKRAIAAAMEAGSAVGSGGSRLLSGNHSEHEALEREAARFFGSERTLYFSSGYAANSALFSTLPQRGDMIFFDALVHASAREGIAASRAHSVSVEHNDIAGFAEAIDRWRAGGGTGRPWIAVESLYSMDGDRAPLVALASLAAEHNGVLVIDEAHATGVFGPEGRGLAVGLEGRAGTIVLHTCGKALGVGGALVAASATVCDYLVNRARNFIYSTAPSPLIAVAVREALRIVAEEPERRRDFQALSAFANQQLARLPGVTGSGSQILPVMIGSNRRAVRIAGRLQAEGFDIRAIRPPTVPEGTARLRITVTLNTQRQEIERMASRLAVIMAEESQ